MNRDRQRTFFLLGVVLAACLLCGFVRADTFWDWLKRDREAQQKHRQGGRTTPETPAEQPASGARAADAAGTADWLIMVYLAGDNNLDSAGLKDVWEMQTVGSSDKLKIAVLMDRWSEAVQHGNIEPWKSARRFLVLPQSELGAERYSWDPALSTCEELGELNMGDPRTLRGFVSWALKKYPARKTLLVLWNHGGGWRSAMQRAVRLSRGTTHDPSIPGIEMLSRGIAWDDSSGKDFLEMREVRGALEAFDKLSIVGADACLMGMLEVAYELRNRADYLVASEELEPGDGWPYDRILKPLAAQPAMAPDALARLIVKAYADFYGRTRQRTTQSAINLAQIPALASRVDAVAAALIAHFEQGGTPDSLFEGIPGFPADSPMYRDLDAVLAGFESKYEGPVRTAARAARSQLQKTVIANHSHRDLKGTGLSIFPGGGFEAGDYRPDIIEFARDTKWDDLLKQIALRQGSGARMAAPPSDRWAVLIGVEKYTDSKVSRLAYAVDDVAHLKSVLIEHAGYKASNIVTLTDEQATVEKVRSTLGTWLPRQAGENDMVLIYFSGHGGAEPSVTGRGDDGTEKYMMLNDSKLDDMYSTALPMSELARIFGRIRSDKLLYVMDACYSGATPSARGVARDGMRAIGLSDNYLNSLAASKGTVVLTAARANEVSMESPSLQRGVFTHWLCEALKGYADFNKDGIVSVVELFQWLTGRVPDSAKKLGASQHPVMKGEITGDFPVAVVKQPPASPGQE